MYRLLTSTLPPNEVIDRVRPLFDPPEVDPKLPALYPGDNPIIGKSSGQTFALRKRGWLPWQWWVLSPGRWFQPVLHGTVKPTSEGSEIFLEGGTPLPMKVGYALLFLACVNVIPVITVFSYPLSISFDPTNSASNFLFGIMLLNVAAAVLLLLPFIGWFLTRTDLEDLYARVRDQVPTERVK